MVDKDKLAFIKIWWADWGEIEEEDFNYLIKTIEHQQTRIQELETIEKAYEALKKAL